MISLSTNSRTAFRMSSCSSRRSRPSKLQIRSPTHAPAPHLNRSDLSPKSVVSRVGERPWRTYPRTAAAAHTMVLWGAAFSVTEVALRHTTPAFTAFCARLARIPRPAPVPRAARIAPAAHRTAVGTGSRHGLRRHHALARRPRRGDGPGRAGDRGGAAQHGAVLRRRDRPARARRARHRAARVRPHGRLRGCARDHPRGRFLERRRRRHRRRC